MIPKTDDQPLGKDKSDIYSVLARLIFANHLKYGNTYHQNPEKFCDSVANHIMRYKLKTSLTSTGTGVLPSDGYANLLAKINSEWKWFSDLDAIWHSNPTFTVASHSSRPGVDHAAPPHNNPPINPHLLQPASSLAPIFHNGQPGLPPAPPPGFPPALPPGFPTHPPQVHLYGLPNNNNNNMIPDNDYSAGTFSAPPAQDHQQDDNMLLNSLPKVAGKKQHNVALPSPSPSPPPEPPHPFSMPEKFPTSFYDTAFQSQGALQSFVDVMQYLNPLIHNLQHNVI
ncbi:uncharacterized protein BJ212DRAFT_1301769 [Suillus subaureus]|uniref:Uncharacterized protein n=1 Tax=Suillus subaureus TaxID=48587 RepID=A0A9P7JAG8_9AGAM|nr:uncharacterized protein BJ212DRAFT_1301769 [Suillus subaureus]KAG1811725.1 hypothetical protein BJ212DRAFT_1301769 [Suillus subaureus]